MTAPKWLYETIADLGKQVRRERARADEAEALVKRLRSTREPIETPNLDTCTPDEN